MTSKKGASQISTLIWAFMGIMVGIALLSATADYVFDATDTTGRATENETLNIITARLADNNIDPDISFSLTNEKAKSITIAYTSNGTVLTEDTDFDFNTSDGTTNGKIAFWNTSALVSTTQNDTSITYTYYTDGYVNNSTSRTLIALITLFFVIAIVAAYGISPTIREWVKGL